ncbi:hypothetical protein ACTXT7_003708, partial [Hymenolepis weldensis]
MTDLSNAMNSIATIHDLERNVSLKLMVFAFFCYKVKVVKIRLSKYYDSNHITPSPPIPITPDTHHPRSPSHLVLARNRSYRLAGPGPPRLAN